MQMIKEQNILKSYFRRPGNSLVKNYRKKKLLKKNRKKNQGQNFTIVQGGRNAEMNIMKITRPVNYVH